MTHPRRARAATVAAAGAALALVVAFGGHIAYEPATSPRDADRARTSRSPMDDAGALDVLVPPPRAVVVEVAPPPSATEQPAPPVVASARPRPQHAVRRVVERRAAPAASAGRRIDLVTASTAPTTTPSTRREWAPSDSLGEP